MKIYDSRNADVVKEFTEDLKEFLNDVKSLDGMKIPKIMPDMGGVYAPTKRWDIIEEGKIYLSINETGYPYLVTRIKVIPKINLWESTQKLMSYDIPQDRIAWASLAMNRDDGTIFARYPENKLSVLDNSNGIWNVSHDFWLYAEPIYIGDLYAMPFGFMNWRGNPLP